MTEELKNKNKNRPNLKLVDSKKYIYFLTYVTKRKKVMTEKQNLK